MCQVTTCSPSYPINDSPARPKNVWKTSAQSPGLKAARAWCWHKCSNHNETTLLDGTCLRYRLFVHLGTGVSNVTALHYRSSEASSVLPKMTKPTTNSRRRAASQACRLGRRHPLAVRLATTPICPHRQHPARRILPRQQCSRTLAPAQCIK